MSKSIYGKSSVNLTIDNLSFLSITTNDIVTTNASVTAILDVVTENCSTLNVSTANISEINIDSVDIATINTSQLNASNASIDLLEFTEIVGDLIEIGTINSSTSNSSTSNASTANITTGNITTLNTNTIDNSSTINTSLFSASSANIGTGIITTVNALTVAASSSVSTGTLNASNINASNASVTGTFYTNTYDTYGANNFTMSRNAKPRMEVLFHQTNFYDLDGVTKRFGWDDDSYMGFYVNDNSYFNNTLNASNINASTISASTLQLPSTINASIINSSTVNASDLTTTNMNVSDTNASIIHLDEDLRLMADDGTTVNWTVHHNNTSDFFTISKLGYVTRPIGVNTTNKVGINYTETDLVGLTNELNVNGALYVTDSINSSTLTTTEINASTINVSVEYCSNLLATNVVTTLNMNASYANVSEMNGSTIIANDVLQIGDVTTGSVSVLGSRIEFDKNYNTGGPNKISLYGGFSGYGIGVDTSTTKMLSGGSTLAFYRAATDTTDGTRVMSLINGKMIIGNLTTEQSYALMVQSGTTYLDSNLYLGQAGTEGGQISFMTQSTTSQWIHNDVWSTDDVMRWFSSIDSRKMGFAKGTSGSGSLTIGNITGTYELNVSGDCDVTGNYRQNGLVLNAWTTFVISGEQLSCANTFGRGTHIPKQSGSQLYYISHNRQFSYSSANEAFYLNGTGNAGTYRVTAKIMYRNRTNSRHNPMISIAINNDTDIGSPIGPRMDETFDGSYPFATHYARNTEGLTTSLTCERIYKFTSTSEMCSINTYLEVANGVDFLDETALNYDLMCATINFEYLGSYDISYNIY